MESWATLLFFLVGLDGVVQFACVYFVDFLFNVSWHGYDDKIVFVVPFKHDSEIESSSSFDFHFIMVFDGV